MKQIPRTKAIIKSPNLLKQLGGFVLYCVGLYADGYTVWPQSHSQAIALGVLGTIGFLFYEIPIKRAIIGSVVTILVGAATYIIVGPVSPPPPWRGWLQPLDEPTPPNPCSSMGAHGMTVLMGNNAAAVSDDFLRKRSNKFIPLSICGRPTMTITRGAAGISVDATIYDLDGSALGAIKNSGYNIPENKKLIVEHSDNLSTLVVHNVKGDELIFIHYLNAHAIRLRVKFPCASRPGYYATVTDETISPVPGVQRGCFLNGTFGMSIE